MEETIVDFKHFVVGEIPDSKTQNELKLCVPVSIAALLEIPFEASLALVEACLKFSEDDGFVISYNSMSNQIAGNLLCLLENFRSTKDHRAPLFLETLLEINSLFTGLVALSNCYTEQGHMLAVKGGKVVGEHNKVCFGYDWTIFALREVKPLSPAQDWFMRRELKLGRFSRPKVSQ